MPAVTLRFFLHMILAAGLCLLLGRCANPVTPKGGPRDKQGPKITKSVPETQTLNFSGDEVVLKFDEFVRMPSYGEDIFVSPFLARTPKISLVGKKIKVKFVDPLRENTTYVLSFTGIKDQNESNPMEDAFTLAFSTGSEIDSMEVEGTVETPYFGEGQKEITLMLFDADSVTDNDLFRKFPAYVTRTGEDGSFKLPYLRRAPFRLYGIMDQDKSNTYSSPTEMLALAADPDIVFSDSSRTVHIELIAFVADDRAPTLSTYDWVSDSVFVCEFTEAPFRDSLQLSMSDTTSADSSALLAYSWVGEKLLVHSPRPREGYSLFYLTHLQDSLGNRQDSTVLIKPRIVKRRDQPLAQVPALNLDTREFEWYMYAPVPDADTALIALVDSSGPLPATLVRDGFRLALRPDTVMVRGQQYFVELVGELLGLSDTTLRYLVKPFDPEDYGTFKGKVRVKGYEGPLMLEFRGKKSYYAYDTVFQFLYLEPGSYQVHVLLDEDGNQTWTPGSLNPYRLPERWVKSLETFTIRANWDFDEQVIEIDPSARAVPAPAPGEGPGEDPELPPELRLNKGRP